MSEVRVHLAGYLAEGEHVVLQPDYDSLKFDFDRVTAERDATRRQLETITADRDSEKLMKAKARIQRDVQTAKAIGLQQRLTAADERADVLEELLREVEAACDLAMSAIDHDERGANFVRIIAAIKAKAVSKRSDELVAQHAAIDFFDSALKPAGG